MKPIPLTADMIDRMRPEDRKALKLKTRHEIAAALEDKSERQMQARVDNLLRLRGYFPRTDAFLLPAQSERREGQRGWNIRLHNTRKNAIILDNLIIGFDGRCLEIEIKTATGAVRPAQQSILAAGGSVALCRSFEEVRDELDKWEQCGDNRERKMTCRN